MMAGFAYYKFHAGFFCEISVGDPFSFAFLSCEHREIATKAQKLAFKNHAVLAFNQGPAVNAEYPQWLKCQS
jgi:hypothetical protein